LSRLCIVASIVIPIVERKKRVVVRVTKVISMGNNWITFFREKKMVRNNLKTDGKNIFLETRDKR
jgi:hypothetical protein